MNVTCCLKVLLSRYVFMAWCLVKHRDNFNNIRLERLKKTVIPSQNFDTTFWIALLKKVQ